MKEERQIFGSGISVHARKQNGIVVHRIWDELSRRYITGVIDDRQAAERELFKAEMERHAKLIRMGALARVDNAAKNGHEALFIGAKTLGSPWCREKKHQKSALAIALESA